MTRINDIVGYLENIAPPYFQEDYDNTGLIIGDQNSKIKGILISLDSTEKVIEEAITKKCNLVIAHHPIIFQGLKKITGKSYNERAIIKAIKNDIAIYAIHTNLDNIISGVNKKIANIIGLTNTKILSPKRSTLSKLITFVPKKNVKEVLDAIHLAGAGIIGNYDHCSFRVAGKGRFKPNENADPFIGEKDEMEEVEEERIEVIFPEYKVNSIISALIHSHPYEEVAYYIQKVENENDEVGSGLIGNLSVSLKIDPFLEHLKRSLNLVHFKYTPIDDLEIRRVAICGGAGAFLIPSALKAGVDAFITSDIKYHDYFEGEGKMLIADIGHYESEVYTKELIFEILSENFSNIALRLSEVNTNPIRYI